MIKRSILSIIRMLDADYMENANIEDKIHGICIDSRQVQPGNLYIPIIGEKNNGHKFVKQAIAKGAKAVLWNKNEENPPKNVVVILVDDTTVALQQLARVYRSQLNMLVVGVTGSNGKTSTKDILASVCATQYKTGKTLGNHNNEIGVPLTLLEMDEDCECAVVEMGMENLGELEFLSEMVKPDIALITNVGTAHLENLKTMENIAKAKMEITKGLKQNGTLIYNGDQKLLKDALVDIQLSGDKKILTFGVNEKNDFVISQIQQEAQGVSFMINHDKYQVDMIGTHQAYNACAAYIVAKLLHIEEENIKKGFSSIEKTGLRNELCIFHSCLILNDSYKSNPQSALAALDTMEAFDYDYKICVLGDMLELGPSSDMIHYQLGKNLKNYHLNEVLTIGDMARYIAQGANNELENVLIKHFSSKDKLIEYLKQFKDKKCMMLVKGSRGMKLDEVVDALCEIE